jgi:hypothetical protein
LCAALDRAVELGLWQHADRVALTAAALGAEYPPLAERVARLRVRQGRVETALAIIDSCPASSASLRLLRAVCLLRLGRGIEAQLDLRQWCRRGSTPLDARVLLACLDAQTGDAESALAALQRNLRQLEHARSLQLLTVLAVLANRAAPATAWAARLREVDGLHSDAESSILLHGMGLDDRRVASVVHARHVEQLANELVACEPAIAVLVEAQHRRLERSVAALLARAVERALPELNQRAAAIEAIVRLSLMLDDTASALLWAERGLALHPRSASLALLAQRLQVQAAVPGQSAAPAEVLASIGPTETDHSQRQEMAA